MSQAPPTPNFHLLLFSAPLHMLADLFFWNCEKMERRLKLIDQEGKSGKINQFDQRHVANYVALCLDVDTFKSNSLLSELGVTTQLSQTHWGN